MNGCSTGRTRPFTGQEYLESLRDGREIWIYGERVKDVTTHGEVRRRECDREETGAAFMKRAPRSCHP